MKISKTKWKVEIRQIRKKKIKKNENVKKKWKVSRFSKQKWRIWEKKNENVENVGNTEKSQKINQIHIYRRDINVSMSRGYWNMFISQKTRSQKNLIFFMFWSISARWAHLFLIVLEVLRLRNRNARSHTWNHFRLLI